MKKTLLITLVAAVSITFCISFLVPQKADALIGPGSIVIY